MEGAFLTYTYTAAGADGKPVTGELSAADTSCRVKPRRFLYKYGKHLRPRRIGKAFKFPH